MPLNFNFEYFTTFSALPYYGNQEVNYSYHFKSHAAIIIQDIIMRTLFREAWSDRLLLEVTKTFYHDSGYDEI